MIPVRRQFSLPARNISMKNLNASALLAWLAGKARDAGGFMEWQVLDWNTPSIEFYKSLGARPVEQWLNYRLEGESLERLAS